MRGFRKRRFPLLAFVPFFQIEVVIAVIIREVPLFNSPDAACHFINEIAVVSDEKNRPVKGLKGGFDGFFGHDIKMVRRFSRTRQLAPSKNQFQEDQTSFLTAGKAPDGFIDVFPAKEHTAQ